MSDTGGERESKRRRFDEDVPASPAPGDSLHLPASPCASVPGERSSSLGEGFTSLPAEWLQSRPVAVIVESHDGVRKETFHIHERALRRMPYFEAYAERWAKGEELKLRLPPDVDIEDFEWLVVHIYTGVFAMSSELKRALAIYVLADVLLMEQFMPQVVAGICRTVHNTEQFAELRNFSMTPAGKGLAAVVAEIESESQDPFLSNLVRAVVGDGHHLLGTPEILELKSSILRTKLEDRAALGLQTPDAHTVLEVLKASAWIGTVYYDQNFKVSPQLAVVWKMVEPRISTESAFTLARGLAVELDRPATLNRVSYRGEQRYSLSFSGNRELAVEVLKGVVRAGAKLAEEGVVPWSEVMSVLPKNYEPSEFENILQPALDVTRFEVELLLPYLKRASLEFLARLLRTSPRATARKIARHVFLDEAALKPSSEVFDAILELRLV